MVEWAQKPNCKGLWVGRWTARWILEFSRFGDRKFPLHYFFFFLKICWVFRREGHWRKDGPKRKVGTKAGRGERVTWERQSTLLHSDACHSPAFPLLSWAPLCSPDFLYISLRKNTEQGNPAFLLMLIFNSSQLSFHHSKARMTPTSCPM